MKRGISLHFLRKKMKAYKVSDNLPKVLPRELEGEPSLFSEVHIYPQNVLPGYELYIPHLPAYSLRTVVLLLL